MTKFILMIRFLPILILTPFLKYSSKISFGSLLAPPTHEIHPNTNMMILAKRSCELKCSMSVQRIIIYACYSEEWWPPQRHIHYFCPFLWSIIRMSTRGSTDLVEFHMISRFCEIRQDSCSDTPVIFSGGLSSLHQLFQHLWLFWHNMEKYTSICIWKIMKL